MTNLFLKVNKDLFNLGLNPTQILILAQVMEFNNNTGDCFISDKVLAENFGVSDSTIKREIKKLEELGYIIRATKNVKGGKVRHMAVNTDKITSVKMSLVEANNQTLQGSNCTLSSVKLSFDKGQIDTIKDNIIDNRRDNIGVDKTAVPAVLSTLGERQEEKGKVPGAAIEVSREWFKAHYNTKDWVTYSQICAIYLHSPTGTYYKIIKG